MSDDKIELNRRRVLGGMITLGGAAAAAGAGTFALFSDTETSSGNTITAGELNLELYPNDSSGTTVSIGVSNLAPGDVGYIALEMSNAGNMNGTLTSASITNLTTTDGTTEFDSTSGAELQDKLEVEAFIEAGTDFGGTAGTSQTSTVSGSGNQTWLVGSDTPLSSATGTYTLSLSLNPTETKYFVLNYNLPSTTGNIVQGDSVDFDIQITLEQ